MTLDITALTATLRDGVVITRLAQAIREEAQCLPHPLHIMEICGGHTHSIMKYGLDQLMPPAINFVHGPGCPVCIMPKERVDHACILGARPDVILVTLGDMLRVPGSTQSLQHVRAAGGDIRFVYSPLDILDIARKHPDKTVVYFAIGFETTTPMSAALLEQAEAQHINNLFFHINHVTVPEPIHALMQDGTSRVNAFLAPGHATAISGMAAYGEIAMAYRTPVAVSGFEPADILEAVRAVIAQASAGQATVHNVYQRSLTWEGNTHARAMIDRCMEPRESFRWKGIGDIPRSALKLRAEFSHRDAEVIFHDILPDTPIDDHKICCCGAILRGLAKPTDCPAFGVGCTPNSPLGSCMVSSEGACSAYFRYRGATL
ncbi:hydrogenase formation protein HypD [Chrysiogenes arsenatis]|uniref:hydrogenase formation protein HypD n=1 Tax=Chrysiogenes arsenatis TaxID=309797 RepID=UPI0003FC6D34|nr:hydrogenase formation protein HypD [Chrysiogenes arsenatis]